MFLPETKKQRLLTIYGESILGVLSRHRMDHKENKGWINVALCPLCGHDNFQCGVHEWAENGRYLHAVKCYHPHDSVYGESPSYADWLAALGEIDNEDAEWLKQLGKKSPGNGGRRGDGSGTLRDPQSSPRAKAKDRVVPENDGQAINLVGVENLEKGKRRLRNNADALRWCTETRGWSVETVERFHLGLSEPYKKQGKTVHSRCLTAPLIGIDGNVYRKYVNYLIPGVSVDNREAKKQIKSWSPGPTQAYYSGKKTSHTELFVCDGIKDLLALAQILRGHPLESKLLLVSSTNGGGSHPAEWHGTSYWDQWDKIYAGHDHDQGHRAGDKHAVKIADRACREIYRVKPPAPLKDWNDFLLEDGTVDEFEALLEESARIVPEEYFEPGTGDTGKTKQRTSFKPKSVHGTWHNGKLYYQATTIYRDFTGDEDDSQTGERKEIIFVRSEDEKKYKAVYSTPLPNTPREDWVIRLTDGTVLDRFPKSNRFATWEWDETDFSIEKYLHGAAKPRKLSELIMNAVEHLRASVWLPNFDDYVLLGFLVAATYCQEIFDAVPLIFVNGPKDTGKSRLGGAMLQICSNATILGRASAATIARRVDASRGFILVDDLEEIGQYRGLDMKVTELTQTLKMSYSKETALKTVTNMRTGEEDVFNFYGIKMINNITGADDTLGSRMLHVMTRKMPSKHRFDRDNLLTFAQAKSLRCEFHAWTFQNASRINRIYRNEYPYFSGRQQEIEAPLRVLAQIANDNVLSMCLEDALKKQQEVTHSDSPEEILRDALIEIIRRAYKEIEKIQAYVSLTQIGLEMKNILEQRFGTDYSKSYGKDNPYEFSVIEKPEWISENLKRAYVENPREKPARTYLKNKKYARAYRLSETFIEEAIEEIRREDPELIVINPQVTKNFKIFCRKCPECEYRRVCDFQDAAMRNAAH